MNDIIKLRNEVIDVIDRSCVRARTDEEYFCVSAEYSRFEFHEVLEVAFFAHGEGTVYYSFRHSSGIDGVSVEKRHSGKDGGEALEWDEAIEELRNKFKEIGVECNGKYL